MSYKTIREVTSITGATESALRYYDEKALVCPTVKKSDGRREWLYDAAAISDISKIMLYRKVGFSVESIRKIFDGNKSETLRILEAKLEELRSLRNETDTQIALGELLIIANSIGDENESIIIEALAQR